MSLRNRFLQRWWTVAVPAAIVTIPLLGLAFENDERRKIYQIAGLNGANPLKSARRTYREIDIYLDFGNFRPIGRFAEFVEQGFVFEAGEATGLAPHAVHGIVRLLMVVILALVAARVVSALLRSAGAAPNHPALAVYPLVLGTALVANGARSPLITFPFLFIGSVALILAVGLAVARDADMQARPLKRLEPATMALLGGVAATTYDLVYVAPVVAAAFIAARATAAGMPVRAVLRTAALRRWAALSIGFMAVFVPSRIAIAGRCAQQSCYGGSDVSLSADVLGLAARRLLNGAPPAGWLYNADRARRVGLDFSLRDIAGNSLLALLLLGIAAVSATAAIRATTRPDTVDSSDGRARAAAGSGPASRDAATAADSAHGRNRTAAAATGGPPRWCRLAVALGMLGAVTAALSTLLASLSRTQQQAPSMRVGSAWRETLLTQVAWSFLIAAVVTAVLGAARTRGTARIAVSATAAILGACLAATLLANARGAQIHRHDPLASVTSQISEATISLDTTDRGNARRCALIDAYTEMTPPEKFIAGPGLRKDLDRLMLGRHGWPFCDTARIAGGDP